MRLDFSQTVHPRVCGELALEHGATVDEARFIPACAGNSLAPRRGHSSVPVHPRVCGELGRFRVRLVRPCGSSPRVRGTHTGKRYRVVQYRFIPACAGNSHGARPRLPLPLVHPRVCGELQQPRSPKVGRSGSSPRVRGTQRILRRRSGVIRFIPACAGNSTSPSCASRRTPVHPRVCGELLAPDAAEALLDGSSPRVRGTPRSAAWPRVACRFIPACAGNSSRITEKVQQAAVHPRVCGELRPRVCLICSMIGSSPRVRGTRGCRLPAAAEGRFIPACAGNSTRRPSRRSGGAVHPRVCGELSPRRAIVATNEGSSPRVRGTRGAGAGRPTPSAVHPRVCGELGERTMPVAFESGSSPRVRGTRGWSWRPCSAAAVHPRVCGELDIRGRAGAPSSGGAAP